MENHHAITGKTHYFDWAIFNSLLLVYQRVSIHFFEQHSLYQRVNVNKKTMDNHHAITGKTHYFYGHFQ